jgi:hypothetical protein
MGLGLPGVMLVTFAGSGFHHAFPAIAAGKHGIGGMSEIKM